MLLLAVLARQYCGIDPRHGASTYMFTRLGMGLSVSPAVWQQFINNVFRELPAKDQVHYKVIMDDVLVFSTFKDHHRLLKMLYALLRKYGLKISPHKCQFQFHLEKNNWVTPVCNNLEATQTQIFRLISSEACMHQVSFTVLSHLGCSLCDVIPSAEGKTSLLQTLQV